MKNILITAVIVILAGAAGYWYMESKKVTDQGNMVACTMDAKMCPDGSYVGRGGPKCEFAACPGATTTANVKIKL